MALKKFKDTVKVVAGKIGAKTNQFFSFRLLEETTFASRQELLARLPSLTSLNGSPVS